MVKVIGKRKHIEIYPFISTLLIIYMLAINNSRNSNLSLIAIIISSIFIFKPVYILSPLFISSLLGDYFVAFKGISISRIIVIIYILGTFFEFIKNNTKFKIMDFITIAFICSFNFFSSATSITGNIIPGLTMTLNLVMMFCMIYTRVDDSDVLLKNFSISILIFTIFITFTILSGNALTVNDRGVDRLVLDESLNANRIGMALAQMSAFIFGKLKTTSNTRSKLVYITIIILNILNLILTGSRSAMLAIISSMLIINCIDLFKMKKIGKKFLSYSIIFIILIVGCASVSNLDYDIIQRFSLNNILETGGTGRLLIWKSLIKYVIPNHLLFGVGIGGENVVKAITPYISIPHGAHNFLITIITQVGIFGSILYFTFFYKNVKKIISKYFSIYNLVIPLTMILTAFINGIGEDIFSVRFLWFDIGLGLMIINNYWKIDNKDEE